MKIRALLIVWTCALVAAAADSTVRDKVYSPDQAKGGKTTYAGCVASKSDDKSDT